MFGEKFIRLVEHETVLNRMNVFGVDFRQRIDDVTVAWSQMRHAIFVYGASVPIEELLYFDYFIHEYQTIGFKQLNQLLIGFSNRY